MDIYTHISQALYKGETEKLKSIFEDDETRKVGKIFIENTEEMADEFAGDVMAMQIM